jgi:hypothetical protein
MEIDDTVVSACMDSGIGNIQGTLPNDLFLLDVGSEYESAGKSDGSNPFGISYYQSGGSIGNSGTFQFDASFWDTFATGAIGFKFGTGNQPDEWFVYQLGSGVTSGSWHFFEFDKPGGSGLSHVNLYGMDRVSAVPIPAAAWLFGSVLVGAGFVGLRKKQA